MNKAEIADTLKQLAGTPMAAAMHRLIEDQQDRVKDALVQAAGDEVLKLQGEYRALEKMGRALSPAVKPAAHNPYSY